MLENVLSLLFISSPIMAIISYAIYQLMKKYLNQKFDINMTRQIEEIKNYLSKDFVIFEKRKEALSEVLLETSKVLIAIKSNFDYLDGGYYLIDEKACNEYELSISKYSLYMNDQSTNAINLILKILRKNSSVTTDLTGDPDLCFDSSDIVMLEYIYAYLTNIFRKELFKEDGVSDYDEIKYLEIAFLIKHFSNFRKITRQEIEIYDYTNQPVLEAVRSIRASKKDVIRLLGIAIQDYEKSETQSQYQYDYIQKSKEYILFLEE